MSAVVCFVKAVSAGAGAAAAGRIRKKEVLTVPSSSTITAEAGEFALVLNTETSGILVAFGATPDAQATSETSATSAGLGIPAGLESPLLGPLDKLPLVEIDWVIVGGESGPKAREMKAEWVRPIRDKCQDAGVPFFFKQWGGTRKAKTGKELDGRIWNELPR